MRSLIVSVLALLAIGGLAVLFSTGSQVSKKAAVAGPARIETTPERVPVELEPVPERPVDPPPTPRPRARREEPTPPEEQEAAAAASRVPSPDLAFQDKYADLSQQDLTRAARTLQSEHRAQVQKLMEERYANAFYDSYPYEYDANGERLDASAVLPTPPPGEHLIRQVFEDPAVDEWRVVVLPQAEYPQLYELYREWKWVDEQAKRKP